MRIGKSLHCLLHGHRYYGCEVPTIDKGKTLHLQRICIHCGKRNELKTRIFVGKWLPMLPGVGKKGERHA